MKRFLSVILALMLSFSCTSLFACGIQASASVVLRVCNCEDYIDEMGKKIKYSDYEEVENLRKEKWLII